MPKKDYGLHKVFNIFDGIDNNRNKLYQSIPRSFNNINTKNAMLGYLETEEHKLIDMLSTPSTI